MAAAGRLPRAIKLRNELFLPNYQPHSLSKPRLTIKDDVIKLMHAGSKMTESSSPHTIGW